MPSPMQDLLDEPEHIYFVYSAGAIKIGYSRNWWSRVLKIKTSCPSPAELILVMPGDRKMELGYHALFNEQRTGGEWFSFDGNLKRFLEHFASPEGKEVLALSHDGWLAETAEAHECQASRSLGRACV